MTAMAKAPGTLELVRAFINTLDVETGRDQLDSPEALRRWLQQHDLLPPCDVVFDSAALARHLDLRETLRALALANGRGEADRAAMAHLNELATDTPLRLTFGESVGMVPACDLQAAGGAAILGAVHRAMLDGTWSRLKACASETCVWAFYDNSRNRSGTWCDMAVCGNRTKVRTYRKRQATVR